MLLLFLVPCILSFFYPIFCSIILPSILSNAATATQANEANELAKAASRSASLQDTTLNHTHASLDQPDLFGLHAGSNVTSSLSATSEAENDPNSQSQITTTTPTMTMSVDIGDHDNVHDKAHHHNEDDDSDLDI